MNQSTLAQGEPWMTPEERTLNHDFIQSTTQLLATRGVPESPLILLRINDVIVTWILARRLESALTPAPGKPAPCPTIAQAGAIGKCRDRLRRAMKELETCCPKGDTPIGITFPQPQHPSAQHPIGIALPEPQHQPAHQPMAPAPQSKQTTPQERPANESETNARTATITEIKRPKSAQYRLKTDEKEYKSTAPQSHPCEIKTDTNTTTKSPFQPPTTPPAPTPRKRKPTKRHRKKRGGSSRR